MSGLFDNKNDGKGRRQERSQQSETTQRKQRRLTIIVVSVLIIALIGALVIYSSFIRRSATAVTIGGRAFSAAEFDYFYNSSIYEHSHLVNSQMPPEFASMMLPVRGQLLTSQIQNPDTGETWADFFRQRTEESLAQFVQLYNAANAAGFVMSEENLIAMEEAINALMEEGDWAVFEGQFPTPMAYLRALFGSSLNEAVLRDVHEFIFTAFSFNNYMRESFTYTQAQMDAFYEENRDNFDIFRYRMLLITPEVLNPMDFTTGDELYDAQIAAQEDAAMLAQVLVSTITSEEEFIEVARTFDEERYEDPRSTMFDVQGINLNFNFAAWLLDDSRAYGDVTTVETEDGTHLLFFMERNDNNYRLASMRQILIRPEPVLSEDFPEFGEDHPGVIAETERAEREASERAAAALAAFEATDRTEAALIELMYVHSDDTTPGGLYEDIAMFPYETVTGRRLMRIVPELEEWLFDQSRQVGDFELIHTEFGYHLIFFAGHGENFRNFIAEDNMRVNDHEQWIEALPEVGAHRHWGFMLTSPN